MLLCIPCMRGTVKLACRCSIALIAQFYPRKHPDNWWLLLCCIIAYAICTAALNLFLLRFEGEVFCFTKATKVHHSVLSGQQQLHLLCHPAHVAPCKKLITLCSTLLGVCCKTKPCSDCCLETHKIMCFIVLFCRTSLL